MREAHKTSYTAATQYITVRMAQINSVSLNAPGVNNARCISEVQTVSDTDTARNEWNGVDIQDIWRKLPMTNGLLSLGGADN